jgi:hypothetical protein
MRIESAKLALIKEEFFNEISPALPSIQAQICPFRVERAGLRF